MRPFYRPPRTAPVISPHTPRWVRKATSDLKTVFTSTLYQVQYIEVKTVFDAPVLSATPDSSGNFTSYSTLGSKGYITPALGLGVHEYTTRYFRLEANVSGFMLPHRWQLLDSDATIAY